MTHAPETSARIWHHKFDARLSRQFFMPTASGMKQTGSD